MRRFSWFSVHLYSPFIQWLLYFIDSWKDWLAEKTNPNSLQTAVPEVPLVQFQRWAKTGNRSFWYNGVFQSVEQEKHLGWIFLVVKAKFENLFTPWLNQLVSKRPTTARSQIRAKGPPLTTELGTVRGFRKVWVFRNAVSSICGTNFLYLQQLTISCNFSIFFGEMRVLRGT